MTATKKKKKKNLLFVSFLSIGLHAQSYFFFGAHRAKGSADDYWCLNAGPYVLKPITSVQEYSTLAKEFTKEKSHAWPLTKMLSAKRPFIIYKCKIKNNDLNCEFTDTYTLQGESLVKIYEELQRLKVSGKYLQEPEILYVYKPKSSN